ncbi:hypothetical protein LINPERHAP1_LOCUS26096 [Linum perenne]
MFYSLMIQFCLARPLEKKQTRLRLF